MKLSLGDIDNRKEFVEKMLSSWASYCERNWISTNHTDVFCGENKVKRFLNGLSYFLLLGDTEGVVTAYKESMNGKREIPMSSCPSHIEDMVYGIGSVLHSPSEEEDAAFKLMLKSAGEKLPVKKNTGKPSPREKRIKEILSSCGKDSSLYYCTVDTENCFTLDGEKYSISQDVEEYAPKHTALGLLYDMDKIICVKSRDGHVFFYDATYSPIEKKNIEKII